MGEATGEILAVDDDDLVLRTIGRMLAPVRAATLRTCTTFAAAVGELRSERRWAAFVFDIRLHGVASGWDLLAEAERRHPRVPALIMTGGDDREAAARAMLSGAAYMCKPVDAAAVAHFARDAVARGTRREAELRDFAFRVAKAIGLTRAPAEYLAARLLGLQDQLLGGGHISPHTASSHRKVVLEALRQTRARCELAGEPIPEWARGADDERFDALLDRVRVAYFRA